MWHEEGARVRVGRGGRAEQRVRGPAVGEGCAEGLVLEVEREYGGVVLGGGEDGGGGGE